MLWYGIVYLLILISSSNKERSYGLVIVYRLSRLVYRYVGPVGLRVAYILSIQHSKGFWLLDLYNNVRIIITPSGMYHGMWSAVTVCNT